MSNVPEHYPGKEYQPLFDLVHNDHDLILLQSQMQDIINCVRDMDEPKTIENKVKLLYDLAEKFDLTIEIY